MGRQHAGCEGVHVDHLLETRLLVRGMRGAVAARAGADQGSPQRRQRIGAALRQLGEPVAVARRLAAESDHAARTQHTPKLGERGGEIREVMQHRVSHDEVEAVVLEGQLGSLAAAGLDVKLEPRGRLGELREHARGDVARHRPLDDACSHQVERE